MATPVKIAIVDDHPVVREGLRTLLSGQPDFEIVAEASDAQGAYPVIARSDPDVVLLDLAMPGATGITVARELLRQQPRRKILMLSMHLDEEHVASALEAGAMGYAGKDQPPAEIAAAIRSVAQGEAYLSPRVSRALLDDYRRLRHGGMADGPLGALSAREREVFDLLVRGYANEAIATELSISRRTVETHRARILRKLHAHSAMELLRIAVRHGLVLE